MFGFGRRHPTTSSSTARRHKWYHRTNPNRRAGGLKAALHNPNTTSAGRRHAKHELNAMGRGSEAKVPLSVRIKHALGIRSHRRQHHHHTTHTY